MAESGVIPERTDIVFDHVKARAMKRISLYWKM